ncbi:MAG: TPM domain-containing protein [Chloroflexota bacterium]
MARIGWRWPVVLVAVLACLLPSVVLAAKPSPSPRPTPRPSPTAAVSPSPAAETVVPATIAPAGSASSGSASPGEASPGGASPASSGSGAPSADPGLLPTPMPGRQVDDFAGIWAPETVDEAEAIVDSLRADTRIEVAVISRPTGLAKVTEAQAIGDASLLMKQWGVGNAGRNDGLVVLFDLDTTLEHGQIRIYPGYDLEAMGLSSSQAQEIFDTVMLEPALSGDLDGALLAGLTEIDSETPRRPGASKPTDDPGAAPYPVETFEPAPFFPSGSGSGSNGGA